MKIYAIIKQVPDTETKIAIRDDASGIIEDGIKWIINPYDEYAIEEALKLKTANAGSTVTVITLGPSRSTDALRTALAMGADDAILVNTDQVLDSFNTAMALATAIKAEGEYAMLFAGKLSIDGNSSAVPQFLAEQLEIPHVTVVSKFTYADGVSTIERDTDGGTKEHYTLTGPALIAANKGLNKPRYASLPGIMKAKKKPLKEIALSDLGSNYDKVNVSFSDFKLPPQKPTVKILEGDVSSQVAELVKLLKDEAKVL